MKGYCGCIQCRKNGEVNPHELFEIYLAQREDSSSREFAEILSEPFSAAELNDMEAEFFKSDVSRRINEHVPFDAHDYWNKYGGHLGGA